jgi:hypothetical protein
MDQLKGTASLFELAYSGKNIIGDSGCKFLSQVSIPHLAWLNLSKPPFTQLKTS